MLLPFDVEPVRTAVGFALCTHCAENRTSADLAHAAVIKLRADWMPDLRILPAMMEAGHA